MRRRGPEDGEDREVLYGIHPVLEALQSGRRTIDRLLVARDGGAGLGRILRLARESGVPVSHLPRELLARKAGARATHQGIVALVSAVPYADPEEVCRRAAAAEGMLLALDRVADPGNLGAILRTAAAAGVHGVLLGEEETVGLTPVVAKASAGAVERIPVARDPRLRRRLESLEEQGFRVAVLDPAGGTAWSAADLTGRLVLVAGGEGQGVRPALRQTASLRITVPLEGQVESLNVSVAVGVLLFEAVRQRRAWKISCQES